VTDEKRPEPPVPAETNVRHCAWFPFDSAFPDSADFLLASGDEVRAHVSLQCRAWDQVPAASLPSDDRLLAALSGAGSKWRRVRERALTGFVLCRDDRFYHLKLAEKALEAWARSDAQRKRAHKRWQGRGTPDADAAAHAPAVPSRGDEKRGDEKRGQDTTGEEMSGARDATEPTGRFAPPSPEEVKKFADSERLVDFDAARFVDHYTANGWCIGKSPMRDWKATVRNWARRDAADERVSSVGGPAKFSDAWIDAEYRAGRLQVTQGESYAQVRARLGGRGARQ
jgi:hypothetical protein